MDAELSRIAASLEKIEAALASIAVVGFVPKAAATFGTPEQEGAAAAGSVLAAEPEKKRGPGRPRKSEAAPAPAQQTTEAPAQASPTPAPAPAAAPAREVTQDQVRDVLRTLASRDGREAAIAILAANGAASVAALDKAKYAAVEAAAQKALAEAPL